MSKLGPHWIDAEGHGTGQYALDVEDGMVVGLTPAGATDRTFMPLTTVVGGVPELVWDDNDSLIPTEVPLS